MEATWEQRLELEEKFFLTLLKQRIKKEVKVSIMDKVALFSVSDQRIKLDILDVFQNAASEVGIPKVDDFNRGDNFGCGYFQVTERNGLRCSAAVGYLNPIKNNKNLKIETKCHVQKINFENNQGSKRKLF